MIPDVILTLVRVPTMCPVIVIVVRRALLLLLKSVPLTVIISKMVIVVIIGFALISLLVPRTAFFPTL